MRTKHHDSELLDIIKTDSGRYGSPKKLIYGNFYELQEISYNLFRQVTFGEAIHFFSLVFESQDHCYKKCIERAKRFWISADTAGVWYDEGLIIQDFPEVVMTQDHRGIQKEEFNLDPQKLELRLGSYEEGGVIYSNDGKTRLAKYGFKTGELSLEGLAVNPGFIAIVGHKPTARKFANALAHSKLKSFTPYIGAYSSSKGSESRIKVPVFQLNEHDVRTYINCAHFAGSCTGRTTFFVDKNRS